MDNEIAVYILTHNRPDTIMRSLNSVRNQSYRDFRIIVSDNSDNNDTEKLISDVLKKDSRVKYVHRLDEECQTGIGHLNYILKNNEYEYFMMFHDDDEMLPDMVSSLYSYILNHKENSAVASNALLNIDLKFTKKKFSSITNNKILSSEKEMAYLYANGGIAPFPSIMYNNKKIKGLSLNFQNGGKYCDAAFVISLLQKGNFTILSCPLMYYYISSKQDSQHHDFSQYLSLIKYVQEIVGKQGVLPMRLFNVYNQATLRMRETGKIYYRHILFWTLLKYSFMGYFIKYVVRLIGYRK